MGQILKRKGLGFYLTMCLVVLSVVTAIAYVNSYANYVGFMSWPAIWLLVGGAVAALALSFTGLNKFAPWVVMATVFTAALLYVKCLYSYVVVVLVGIDLNSFTPQFMLCSTLFVVSLLLSIINIYFKQEKEEA